MDSLAAVGAEFMELCHKNRLERRISVSVTIHAQSELKTDLRVEKAQNTQSSNAETVNDGELRECESFWYWGSRF